MIKGKLRKSLGHDLLQYFANARQESDWSPALDKRIEILPILGDHGRHSHLERLGKIIELKTGTEDDGQISCSYLST